MVCGMSAWNRADTTQHCSGRVLPWWLQWSSEALGSASASQDLWWFLSFLLWMLCSSAVSGSLLSVDWWLSVMMLKERSLWKQGHSEELAQETEEQQDDHSSSTSASPSLTGSDGSGRWPATPAMITPDVVASMEDRDSSIPTLNTVCISLLFTCTKWPILSPTCKCEFRALALVSVVKCKSYWEEDDELQSNLLSFIYQHTCADCSCAYRQWWCTTFNSMLMQCLSWNPCTAM